MSPPLSPPENFNHTLSCDNNQTIKKNKTVYSRNQTYSLSMSVLMILSISVYDLVCQSSVSFISDTVISNVRISASALIQLRSFLQYFL